MSASFRSGLLAGVAVIAGLPAAADAEPYRFHADHVLGTSLDIAVAAGNPATALMAAEAARAEVARLDGLLSGWRPDSDLSRLNAAGVAAVSPELFAVLTACERWGAATDGAFSCRLGAVEALWRGAEAGGFAPEAAMLEAAARAAANAQIALDRGSRQVRLGAGTTLAIDGLAKGWIIDAAGAAALRAAPDVTGLMIDIGGDLRCWGRAGPARDWQVGVVDPARPADNDAPLLTLALANKAVAASGRGPRDRCIGGTRYSHLLSPVSGDAAANETVFAAVAADRAADADALATALAVVPPQVGLALARRFAGVEALLITGSGERLQSGGWASLETVRTPLTCAAADGAGWPAGFAVTVDYEVPKIASSRYHAPYLVMWITDPDGQMVRTLLMLGRKSEWAPENYIWWRRYGRRTPDIVDSVARATRAPGRYSVAWDGRDDNGKRVGQGRYVLHIEATREHGGHSYQSVGLELGAAGADFSLSGKDEIGALQARYGERK